ncbi:MAG: hypothetical protein F4Y69_04845 [Chloroflexi bacterium]|nr:hypothetical protein [Chloroflexota bacterium]MYF21640.1 hypothetical protein [Chloroflexota bacterium]
MNARLRWAWRLARREPVGALGLLVLLFWSVLAIGAIGSGGGWLGVGRYDRADVFQELNPEFVYYRVSLALDGVPSDVSNRELRELLAAPEVYGGFADAVGAQELIQQFVQPLVEDETLIPLLLEGRRPWLEEVDGVFREADTGLIRDSRRPLMPAALKPPSWNHWFGTDRVGHDIYAAVVDFAWQGWLIGLLAALLGVSGGALVAVVGRVLAPMRHGGAVSAAIKSVLDGLLALPPIVLLLLVLLGHDGGTWALTLPLAAIALPLVWRELVERGSETVAASSLPTFLRERAPSLVRVFRDVMILALLFEAVLSLIGLGAEPGSWGVLIAYGRQWMLAAPWMTLMSGLALTSLLLGHYAFGSGLKNLLTPHGPSSDSPAGAPEDSTDSFEWSDEHELV